VLRTLTRRDDFNVVHVASIVGFGETLWKRVSACESKKY
jgi:hypothetical protein